jgi:hypothetical protein
MSRVILKCLEKSRDRRYQSAAAVLEELISLEKSLPVTRQVTVKSKPLTTREITVKFSLKKALVPGLIVAGVVIIALIILINKATDRVTPAKSRQMTIIRPDDRGGQKPGLETKRAGIPLPSPPDEPGRIALSGGGTTSGIVSFLAPFIKDPSKFIGQKDAQEVEKVLVTLKEKYPAEAAAFSNYIDNIQTRIEQAKKQKEAGNVEASQKSYDRGESEMRKLLAQVSERERAEEAFKELQDTKQKIGASPRLKRPNLLTWIATEKEKDAADAFAKDDFSGARILYGILTRVHGLSLRIEDEEQGLAALRELTGSIRKDAETAMAPTKQAWLFDRAKTEEEGARKKAVEKLILQAAEQYILSAFLFEKAKEVALESAQAGRD